MMKRITQHRATFGMSKLALACVAAFSVAALAASARVLLAPARHEAPAAAAPDSPDERVEVEVIIATPFGFEPAEVTRPGGRFILATHNNSGAAELSLRLDRVQGGRLREVRMAPGSRRSHQELRLPPGEYVLTEAAHPEWACRITLTP